MWLLMTAGLALAQAGTPEAGRAVCDGARCAVTLTAPELLEAAERLVLASRYVEAGPLVAALANAPGYEMERRFLEGYIAVETGDPAAAAAKFRSILSKRPELVRVRLELARALAMIWRDSAADYHFRLAEEAELPPEIERTIYASRSLIRDRKPWELDVSLGLAPDTNINGATADRSVDVNVGGATLPLELDRDARRRSGVGQTGSVFGAYRFGSGEGLRWRVEAETRAVNYAGAVADDIFAAAAAGPEWRSGETRLSLAATAARRWYGGGVAQALHGGRLSLQRNLSAGARVGAQLDARRVESEIDPAYDGWSLAANAAYERVVRRSMVASVSAFARREPLRLAAYSSSELGVAAGIGGELPFGVNGGLSLSGSRAVYDAALPIFDETRREWRTSARLYAGLRSLRFAGFSPSVAYTYAGGFSTVGLYDVDRHRVEFQLARYF